MNISEKVCEIISEVIGQDVDCNNNLELDLDVDSTEMVEIVIKLSKSFKVKLPTDLKADQTVLEISNVIEELVA